MDSFYLRIERRRHNEMSLALCQRPIGSKSRLKLLKDKNVVSLWGLPLIVAKGEIEEQLRRNCHPKLLIKSARHKIAELSEDRAVRLGLLFFALKPMRKIERMREVLYGIAQMSREEAGYWFSKACNSPSQGERMRSMRALRIMLSKE